MGFEVHGTYDPETNIAFMTHIGEPSSREDLDRAFEKHLETWGNHNHKVYVISDMRNAGKGDYGRVSYHVSRMKRLRKERAALTVMIADSIESKFTVKLYQFISGIKITTASNVDDAIEMVKKVQKTEGVFPSLAGTQSSI